MNTPIEATAYVPPKSAAFGHHSHIHPARVAWDTTVRFLEAFTSFELASRVSLDCYAPSPSTAEEPANHFLAAARAQFGPEIDQATITRHWDLTSAQAPAAIELALSDTQWPKQELGPIWLSTHYTFHWKTPHLPEPNPLLQGLRPRGCSLGLIFSRRSLFLQPTFVFPVAPDSSIFKEFLALIEPQLPFKLRPQCFKRVLVNPKTGKAKLLRLASHAA